MEFWNLTTRSKDLVVGSFVRNLCQTINALVVESQIRILCLSLQASVRVYRKLDLGMDCRVNSLIWLPLIWVFILQLFNSDALLFAEVSGIDVTLINNKEDVRMVKDG